MIISRTPLRISFLGGGTDLPAWTARTEGACLSVTIDKYCWITLRRLPPFFDHTHRVVWSKVEEVIDIQAIQHPVVRATLAYYGFSDGLEVHHQGDLPARSGMGSSSAFTVGFLHALSALRGEILSKAELAHRAVTIEQEVLRETVGAQDQYAAAHGGLNLYRFHGSFVQVQPLPAPEPLLREFNARLQLYRVGPRPDGATGSTVSTKYAPKDHHLRTMAAMVDSGLRMLAAGALDDLGSLLGDAWELKRELGGVSDDRIDEFYRTALAAGALGGKLLGAGAGGFLLLYVPPDRQPDLKKALAGLLHVPFCFEREGSQLVYYNPGAAR